jgi:peptidoglycan/LPS O-acetylase OafA/YrhL
MPASFGGTRVDRTSRRQTPGSPLAKIDALRGLAALFVALCHTIGFVLLADYGRPIAAIGTVRELLLRLVVSLISGQASVVVLFLVSGFVLGRSLDRLNAPSLATVSYFGFILRRAVRLYPAHAVSILAIAVAGWLVLGGKAPIDFSHYPALDDNQTPGWLNGVVFDPPKLKSILGNLAGLSWSLNLVAWSVYVQLAAAPVLPLLHALSRTNRCLVDAGSVAGLLVLAYALGNPLWVSYWFVFHLGLLIETRGRDWSTVLSGIAGSDVAAVAAYVATVLPTLVFGYHNEALYVLAASGGAFSLVSLIVWRGAETRMFRVLDLDLLRWIGRRSYSFYLWHYVVLTVWVRQLFAAITPDALGEHEWTIFTVMAAVSIAGALAIAHVSFTYVEAPSLELGRSVLVRLRCFVNGRMFAAASVHARTAEPEPQSGD